MTSPSGGGVKEKMKEPVQGRDGVGGGGGNNKHDVAIITGFRYPQTRREVVMATPLRVTRFIHLIKQSRASHIPAYNGYLDLGLSYLSFDR